MLPWQLVRHIRVEQQDGFKGRISINVDDLEPDLINQSAASDVLCK